MLDPDTILVKPSNIASRILRGAVPSTGAMGARQPLLIDDYMNLHQYFSTLCNYIDRYDSATLDDVAECQNS